MVAAAWAAAPGVAFPRAGASIRWLSRLLGRACPATCCLFAWSLGVRTCWPFPPIRLACRGLGRSAAPMRRHPVSAEPLRGRG